MSGVPKQITLILTKNKLKLVREQWESGMTNAIVISAHLHRTSEIVYYYAGNSSSNSVGAMTLKGSSMDVKSSAPSAESSSEMKSSVSTMAEIYNDG